MSRTILLIVLTVGVSLLNARSAKADEASEILSQLDRNLTLVKDQAYDAELQVIRDGKVQKTLMFNVKLKGLAMKLIRFTAPGDVKGMAVLTTADNLMYVYLPSYQRVRRVAAHVRNQGFMGTDFSPEEMGSASLSLGYTAVKEREDAESTVLLLTPKAGNETLWSQLRVFVSKKLGVATKLESIDAAGKVARTQLRENWKTEGKVIVPGSITVIDHKTGSKSVINFLGVKLNQGLSDDEFTKRAIMRAD